MKKPLIFFALLLFSFVALAEPAPAPTNISPPKVYEIEVMVFQNIQSELEGDEFWVNERVNLELKDIDKAVEVKGVPQEDSALTRAREVLDADASYRVLAHKQWLQNAEPPSDAKLVRFSTENGELNGTFKFFRSRFLHLDLNFIFQEKESKSIFQVGSSEEGSLVAFQLREKRRIKSNEIQYFDHPKFGVLVQVKQVKESTN